VPTDSAGPRQGEGSPTLHQAHVAPDGRPRGALVLLHGFGADELDLLGLADALPEDLLYVSLRAPLRLPWGGYAWFPLRALPGGPEVAVPWPDHGGALSEAEGLAAAVRDVVGALRSAAARGDLDAAHTVLAGFSQGAAVAAAVMAAAEAPALAGYALLSGFDPEPSPAAGAVRPGVPAFVAHGTADALLPVALGRALRDRLTAAGAVVTYAEYPMAHAICDDELAELTRWLGAVLPPVP
jgi:phospholipase/carboxylesterase